MAAPTAVAPGTGAAVGICHFELMLMLVLLELGVGVVVATGYLPHFLTGCGVWWAVRRLVAALSLAALRWDCPRWIARAGAQVLSGYPLTRRRAATYLRDVRHPQALRALIDALNDREADVRRLALTGLARLELTDGRLALALITLLRDEPDPLNRWSARNMLKRHAGETVVDGLLLALATPNCQDRAGMIELLREFGDRRAVPLLIKLLVDPQEKVRQEAAAVLGKLGDPTAVEPLMAALADAGEEVVGNAARSLGELGDQRAVEPLLTVLTHESRFAYRAAEALGQLGDARVLDTLVRAAGHPEYGLSTAAIQALGHLRDARATGPLVELLAGEHAHLAARALCELDPLPASALPALERASRSHPSAWVRKVCAQSVARIRSTSPREQQRGLSRAGSPTALAERGLSRGADSAPSR